MFMLNTPGRLLMRFMIWFESSELMEAVASAMAVAGLGPEFPGRALEDEEEFCSG